ncbi:hypothetical protein K1719_046136 [Acacia pycnantha]|nr:hypothetical protein K1719_046136 [Acacia pycnantha]
MRLLQLGLLLSLASGFAAIIIYITGVSNPSVYGSYQLTDDEIEALLSLQNSFQQCVSANGLGLKAVRGRDYCQTTINSLVIPSQNGEIPKLVNWKLCPLISIYVKLWQHGNK